MGTVHKGGDSSKKPSLKGQNPDRGNAPAGDRKGSGPIRLDAKKRGATGNTPA